MSWDAGEGDGQNTRHDRLVSAPWVSALSREHGIRAVDVRAADTAGKDLEDDLAISGVLPLYVDPTQRAAALIEGPSGVGRGMVDFACRHLRCVCGVLSLMYEVFCAICNIEERVVFPHAPSKSRFYASDGGGKRISGGLPKRAWKTRRIASLQVWVSSSVNPGYESRRTKQPNRGSLECRLGAGESCLRGMAHPD